MIQPCCNCLLFIISFTPGVVSSKSRYEMKSQTFVMIDKRFKVSITNLSVPLGQLRTIIPRLRSITSLVILNWQSPAFNNTVKRMTDEL